MNLQGPRQQATAQDAAVRRLGWAFAASVAIHLVVLWPASHTRPLPQLMQPLAATLRPVDAPPPPAAAPRSVASGSQIKATSPRPGVAPAEPPSTLRRGKPESRRAIPVVPAAPDQPAKTGSGADSSSAATTTLSVSSGEAGIGNEDGLDPDALRQFRFAVSRAAHPDYPRLAVEHGWSGTAHIRVTIGKESAVQGIRLARSSGYAVLDAKAEEIIGRAARATAIPRPLQGREFVVDLPVEFKLEDKTLGE